MPSESDNGELTFEAWYRTNYRPMVNTLAMVTGDHGLAVEATAEACTKALARWDRVRKMARPGGWIYRVALNEARRRARRRSREQHLLTSVLDLPVVSPPVHGDTDLWAAVARLPERTRAAVVLRYVADLTEPEVARALKISRGSVATMLRRAHERLARELGPTQPIPIEEQIRAYSA